VAALPARRAKTPLIATAVVAAIAAAGLAAWLALRSDGTVPAAAAPLTERQLTTNPLLNPIMVAAISPDGRYVAYADTTAIHIRLIETGETRTLPVPAGYCFLCASLSWSADGTRILSAGPAGPAQRDGLWSISTLTGEIRQMLEDARAVQTSPAGSRIVFLRGEADIWIAKDDGTDAKLLFSGGQDFLVSGVAWSPDGQWLAYLRRNRGAATQSIEARHVTAGEVRELVPAASLEEPVWIDRGLLYMTHVNVDTHDVWELTLDAATAQPKGPPARITRWNGFIPGSLSSTSDGTRMVMSRQTRQSDVYIGTPGAAGLSDQQQLTVDTRYDVPWQWRGPGELLFVTNRDGSDDVWKQPVSGSGEAVVAGPEHARNPQLTPDGKSLLYLSWPVPPPGTPQPPITLMRMLADGGASEPVLQSTGASAGMNYLGWSNTYPAFRCPSAPAARCVIAEEEKNTLVFSAFDPMEGRRMRVGRVEAPPREIAWDLSADGTQIAYLRWAWDDGHKISVMRLQDGRVTEIPMKGWTSLSAVAWAPDGASLYVISARRNGSALLRVSLNGQVTTLRSDTGSWLLNPRLSPDGRRLAFAATTADSKVWLVER
jgi:Tol biopolymer transport system component